MSIASAKMPAVVVSGVICLLLGVAGGIVIASFVETGLDKKADDDEVDDELEDDEDDDDLTVIGEEDEFEDDDLEVKDEEEER